MLFREFFDTIDYNAIYSLTRGETGVSVGRHRSPGYRAHRSWRRSRAAGRR